MSEYAESSALESNGLSDLASFLSDTPEDQEPEQEDAEATAEESTTESDTEDSTDDGQDIDPDSPDGEDESPTPTETKITFTVKKDDGSTETVEATTEEIAKSYMRQADFTKKTTALAERESEAVKFLTSKHEELRSQYLSQAELSRAAIVQMAGIKTEDQMAELASSDPAAWVAENQRQRQINNYLNGLNQQIEGEKQKATEQAEQRNSQARKAAYETAWQELSKDGIDKPKLQKIYSDVSKNYGFSQEELGALYDHRLVRAFKDAAAYQALKAQKPTVMAKAQAAPRMPTRQQAPAQERIDKAIDNKFKSGRAKLNDLAAFLR
jgi:hypothetical protein